MTPKPDAQMPDEIFLTMETDEVGGVECFTDETDPKAVRYVRADLVKAPLPVERQRALDDFNKEDRTGDLYLEPETKRVIRQALTSDTMAERLAEALRYWMPSDPMYVADLERYEKDCNLIAEYEATKGGNNG